MRSQAELSGLRIVLAAPPFCGHLHPILAIGGHLQAHGADCVVVTGPNKIRAVEACGLRPFPVLASRPDVIESIADTDGRMTLNPVTMYRQASANLALIPAVMEDVAPLFDDFKPDIVIADFTAFAANWAAERRCIPHITVTPSPLAIENTDGTPGYFGGWSPGATALHRMRDYLGRKLTRGVKRGFSWPFRQRLARLGFGVYRADGTEAIYSAHATLGLGMAEMEFPRSWPDYFKMIGPIPFCPEVDLRIDFSGLGAKPKVLVTAGTHVWWAKRRLLEDTAALRQAFPDVHFVYSRGDSRAAKAAPIERTEAYSVYDYIPYDQHLELFDAVLHHGGTGIMYSCIEKGLPALVRPLDFDQLDYAARIDHFGAGIRVESYASRRAIDGLRRILDRRGDFAVRSLQARLRSYDPLRRVHEEVARLTKAGGVAEPTVGLRLREEAPPADGPATSRSAGGG